MKNKKSSIKSCNSNQQSSLLNSYLSEGTNQSSKPQPHQMLNYYKMKSEKLEKDFDNLLEILDQIKATCDLTNEFQSELNERNEEVSKLQMIVGELQIHLFREKEKNLKLSAENDELKIQDYENRKRIKALLMVTGMCERKYLHFLTQTSQDKLLEPKLPEKLQKLKQNKQKEAVESAGLSEEADPQVLLLKNQVLASQLEHQIKMSRDEINVLLKDKELSNEERQIERERLQKENDLLRKTLKQSQDLLCETTGKLVKSQQVLEREKTSWMEEKDGYLQAINKLKEREGIEVSDIFEYCLNGVANSTANRFGAGRGSVKESPGKEMNADYQEQVLSLEAEVNRLRERAQICKNKFREKTEKMTAQVTYLKNKYEDLDRRRLLEAEGFRTDIRMLRERVKELEKKLGKVFPAAGSLHSSEQQQLLISARNTLSRARQLEKELVHMKSKISCLETNDEAVS